MDKTLLITGAGRGVGAATARLAARAGWHVAVNYQRDEASAAAVAAEVRALGRQAVLVRADVADEAQVKAMFEAVDASSLPPLGGLVNNAGIVDAKARIDEQGVARWRRMLEVNVIGTFACTREALLRLSTRHGGAGGAIVNVSSVAARLGSPGEYVDYAASKGAIDTFTVGLAREVATEGVRVNAVRPGITDTEIHASGGQPDRVARIGPMVPMQRAGSAEEIAAAIVWLLSNEAAYTTGALLDVSGGR